MSEPASKHSGTGQAERKPSYLPHVARGASINFSGSIARLILLYGYTLLLARMLPADELGQYFLMFTIINILGFVSVAGLDLGVVRFVSMLVGDSENREARRVVKAALVTSAAIGSVVMVVLYFVAPSLADPLFDGSSTAVAGLRIFAIAIPFWATARIFNSTTQALHRMQYQVYSRDLGEQLSKFAISALVLVLGAGLMGVVWANVASLVIAAAMSMIFVMLMMPAGVNGPRSAAAGRVRGMFRYSLPLAFSNIFGIILLWTDMLMVGFIGTSEDAGYYGAALRVGVTGSVAILTAFRTVFAPVISDLYNKERLRELQGLFKTVTRWIFICSLPLLLLIMLFADPVMRLFGGDFSTGSGALVLLAVGQLINAGTGLVGLMVIMTGRSHMELLNVLVALAVNITLCILLIPGYGVMGAALANMSAVVAINLLRALEVWVFMRMNAYDSSYTKPIIGGVAGAAIVGALLWYTGAESYPALGLLAALFLLIYISAIMLLGLNEQDRAVMAMMKARLRNNTA